MYTVSVQVIHVYEFPSRNAEKELQEKLKLRFLPDKIDLNFLDCSRDSLTKRDLPSLIIYLRNASKKRESDINSVMKNIKGKTNLVIAENVTLHFYRNI